MNTLKYLFIYSCLLLPATVWAHGPIPAPLTDAPIPPVPGLMDGPDPIIVDKDMAIALGKALFWDQSVGSDGVACGTCHFHAGADRRIKNQRNTGTFSTEPTGQTFEINALGGANHSLRPSDFPLYRFENPLDKSSEVIFSTDDVISSSGTFSGKFHNADRFSGMVDNCDRQADPIHNVNGLGTRRVEPRNAPTMINAIFNHRNFWDGRANNVFNGSSNWGDRDPDAGVYVKINSRTVEKQRLELINSSLASQAIATVQSDTEMVCQQRKLPDVGRKLLNRRPLEFQKVHNEDSVLGKLSYSKPGKLKPGLKTTYKKMIRKAFNKKYWSYSRRGKFGAPTNGGNPYDHMEANFAMFFGLALQVYEATLVSDQAPIDTAPRGENFRPVFADEAANRGLGLFLSNHCNLCHAGPLMSGATIVTNSMMLAADPDAFGPDNAARHAGLNQYGNVIARASVSKGESLLDFGYFNTGVADPRSDPGVGGLDDFGNSISLVSQYHDHLLDNSYPGMDPGITDVYSCVFEFPLGFNTADVLPSVFTLADGIQQDPNHANCLNQDAAFLPTQAAAAANKNGPKMFVSTQAGFKMPTLRNVELTGPYMHNGSMATLDEVLQFYTRGGNFNNPDLHNLVGAGGNAITPEIRADLIAFLNTFTDDRVRYERAPFDHPEIIVPNGAKGDEESVESGNPISPFFAKEDVIVIPAVGANGRAKPLQPFDSFLEPDES